MYLTEISSRVISFCHSESEGPMFASCHLNREALAAGNGKWDRDQGGMAHSGLFTTGMTSCTEGERYVQFDCGFKPRTLRA
jgi:hypothetical protein